MAGPGGREAGRVTVRVVPDTSKFSEQLRRELSRIDDVEVDVKLNTAGVVAEFRALKARLERQEIDVPVDVDRRTLTRVPGVLARIGGAAAKAAGSLLSIGSSLTRTGGSFADFSGSVGQGVGTFGKFGAAVAGAGIAVGQLALRTTGATVLMGALSSAVLAAAGAITAAIGGLPALVATAGAGLGAIVLGFDGIKNAAKTLAPQLESLKSSLSGTFQAGLTPVFERLAGLFPTLQDGLTGVAQSLAGFASGLTDVITSSAGMENIRKALDGTRILVDTMTPGFQTLTREFLNLAGMEPLYRALGDTLNMVAEGVGQFFANLRESGQLTNGLRSIQHILYGVGKAFEGIAMAGLDFFAQVAPGIQQTLTAIGNFFGRFEWSDIGSSVGGLFESIANGIKNIPQDMINLLQRAFIGLADGLGKLVESGAINLLVGHLVTMGVVAGFTVEFINALINAFRAVGTAIVTAAQWVEDFKTRLLNAAMAGMAGFVAAIQSGFESAKNIVMGVVRTIGDTLRQMRDVVVTTAQNAWNGFRNATSQGINGAIGFVRSIPGRVLGAIGNLGSILFQSGVSLIRGFANGIRSAIGSAVAAARNAVSAVRRFFPFSPAKEGPFSGRGYTTYSGRALAEDWAAGIKAGSGSAVRAVESMMASTNQAATAEWQGHISSDSFGGVAGAVYDGVLAAFNGSRLQVDGTGMAKLVNKTNSRNLRR